MPKTPTNAANETEIFQRLLRGSCTRAQLGCTRYKLEKLVREKLVRRAGEVKLGDARRAVAYELTAKGKKRAEKL